MRSPKHLNIKVYKFDLSGLQVNVELDSCGSQFVILVEGLELQDYMCSLFKI